MRAVRKRYPKALGVRHLSPEQWSGILLFLFLSNEAIMHALSFAFYRLGNQDIGIYAYIFVQYVLTIGCLGRFRISAARWGSFLAVWAVAALAFGLSFLAHPENSYYFTRNVYGVFERVFRPDMAIYAFLFFRLCVKPGTVLRAMYWSSLLLFLYNSYLLLNAWSAGGWEEYNAAGDLTLMEYSLVYGYQALFPALVFAYRGVKGHKLSTVLMLLTVAQIILGGSRGSLLIFAGFWALMIVLNWRTLSNAKYAALVLLPVIGLFFSANFNQLLTSLGESSRTIQMMLSGSLADDNGRAQIQTVALELIRTGGPFGRGVYGDRPYLTQLHFAGYPHNLFLELLTNYGWLLGGALCLLFAVNVAYMVFRKRGQWRDVYLIVLFQALQLMISQSYWYVWAFWGAMAVTVNDLGERRTHRMERERNDS